MTRLLVFGAGGQVGRHLLESPLPAATEIIGLTRQQADICDPLAVAEWLNELQPSVVINSAAYTAVDKAESEPAQAFRVNRDGARVLAEASARSGVPLIHLSTDYVFDGQSTRPYSESDPVAPQGIYARSKEKGERDVRAAQFKHIVLRTAWVYGPFGANFMRTMLRLGGEREELGIVADQIGSPTATGDIAAAILGIAGEVQRPDFQDWGTYHYVGGDIVSWHGFAEMIFAEAERFGCKTPRLRAITTADYPTPAKRPAYSVLSTAKIERTFGIRPMPLRASLIASLRKLFSQKEKAA